MTVEEIEIYLQVNKIEGQVYVDREFDAGKYIKKDLRVKTNRFQIERNKKSVYELKVTWSNQVVDAEFMTELNILTHLVKLLNK